MSSGLSVGSPLTKHRFHFVKPKSMAIFRPNNTQTIIYCINYNTNHPNSLWTVQNEFQIFPQFSPKFWDRPNGHSRPQTLQINYKALKTENNRVGEDPYLLELSKLQKIGVYAEPLQRRTTLLFGPTRTEGPKAGKSREKLHFLSLKTLNFFKICSPLSPLPDPA